MVDAERSEVLRDHKNKWDTLAKENDRYYVRSVEHEQSDEEYELSGRKHVADYILSDSLLYSLLSPLSTKSVLEIGCGSGRITKTLATTFGQVAALDISRTMLEKAREFVDKKNVIYLESNGQDVPLFPETVDFAFSYIVYQHFPTKDAIEHSFAQVHKALKSQGLFKVQIRGMANPNPKHWAWGPHFSEKEAESLASNVGFEILRATGAGTQYYWLLLQKG